MIHDVTFAGSTVRIEHEGADAARLIDFLFARMPADGGAASACALGAPADKPPHVELSLHTGGPETTYTLTSREVVLYRGTSPGTAGRFLLERIQFHLADRSRGGLLIHAAALTQGNECVLLPGRTGSGKTTLAAYLAGRGFGYLTDELVYIPSGALEIVPFMRPLNVRRRAMPVLGLPLDAKDDSRMLTGRDIALFWPTGQAPAMSKPPLSRIVFPTYEPDAPLESKTMSPAETGLALMSCLINARNLDGHGFAEVARVAGGVPAFRLHYGDPAGIVAWLA